MNELRAYMWWCGDEWCDCYQPIVERVVGVRNGPVRRHPIWQGTFYSHPSRGEWAEQEWELADAKERFGLSDDDRPSVLVDAPPRDL